MKIPAEFIGLHALVARDPDEIPGETHIYSVYIGNPGCDAELCGKIHDLEYAKWIASLINAELST